MTEKTLERYAEARKIAIYRLPLTECGSLAIDCGHERSAVGLDNSRRMSSAESVTRLAHELGHCCTGSFYTKSSAADSVERNEARAWALAELFGVTEDMVRRALAYYAAKGTEIV